MDVTIKMPSSTKRKKEKKAQKAKAAEEPTVKDKKKLECEDEDSVVMDVQGIPQQKMSLPQALEMLERERTREHAIAPWFDHKTEGIPLYPKQESQKQRKAWEQKEIKSGRLVIVPDRNQDGFYNVPSGEIPDYMWQGYHNDESELAYYY